MVFLPPGGPNQGERYEITGPVFPISPEAQDGLLDLAPGTPAWSTVTPWVYGLPVQGSKPPRTCVTYQGSTFVAVQDDPSGTIVPGTDPATWVCVAEAAIQEGALLLIGGTMTGPLILAADPVNALDAATKQYVDAETTARQNADALLVPLAQKAAPGGIASLDGGGKVPLGQLPAIVANTIWPNVASEAAMLALAAEPGDIAQRTDVGNDYMLAALPATTLANWIEFLAPTAAQVAAAVAVEQARATNAETTETARATVAEAAALASATGRAIAFSLVFGA